MAAPLTYEDADQFLGLRYSARLDVRHTAERRRDGSIRVVRNGGLSETVLTLSPHVHDYRLTARYTLRNGQGEGHAQLCTCGAYKDAGAVL